MVVTLIIIICSSVLVVYNIRSIKMDIHGRLDKITELAKTSLSSALWQYNLEYVNDYVDALFFYEDIVHVRVRQDNMDIKIRTIPRYQEMDVSFFRGNDQFIHKTVSVLYDTVPIGDVFIVMTLERVKKQIFATSLYTFVLIMTIVISIIITVFVFTEKFLFTPLLKLELSIREISTGNIDAPIDVSAADELGELARNFRGMIENIKIVTASRDELNHEVGQRIKAERALQQHRDHLEEIVEKRTRELKLAQETLVKKEKLATIGELSGNISHELKNALGVIDSSVYFLSMVLSDADEKVKKHLGRIKSAVVSSDGVIRSLAHMTRVSTLEFKPLNVISLITDAIDAVNPPDTMGVKIHFPAEKLIVSGDCDALFLSFKNIVKNAVLSMEGRGTLTVMAKRKKPDQVCLSFADTGPGIDKALLEKIFEPLFTTRAKGMGFGLSITRNVIEKHHGCITAASEKGGGAVFSITLPLCDHPLLEGSYPSHELLI